MKNAPKNDQDPERPIWGIKAIAEVIGRSERPTFHMVASGQLPVKKIGNRYCAYPSALREALRADTGEAA